MSDIMRVNDRGRRVATAQPSRQAGSYEEMKARVQTLKKEQQRALEGQKAAHTAESASLLEQRMAFESKIAQLEAQITGLNQQVKQTNERSAKLRSCCEREKKALQTQLDQANKTLQGIDCEHANEVNKLTNIHEKQVASLQKEFTQMQQDMQVTQARLKAEYEDQVSEVEQWCQGEIEAVRHMLGGQVHEATAQTRHWQHQHSEEVQKCLQAEAAVLEAEQQLKKVMDDDVAMAAELEACQQRISSLGAELEHRSREAKEQQEEAAQALAAKHSNEMGLLKKNHRQQLDTIDSRLHDVLARKDHAIAALRGELRDVTRKLHEFETLIFEAGLG